MVKPLLLVALSCLAFAGHGQGLAKQKDNTILIQTPDSAIVALRTLGKAFVAQGYTIEKLDSQFLTLTLAPKTLPTAFSPILVVHATAAAGANSLVRLSGEFKAFAMGTPIADVSQLRGSEKGVYSSTFRSMQKAALAYPAAQVSYARQ